MPRRLIIGILSVLILGILGGTVVLVIKRLKPNTPTTATSNTPSPLPSSNNGTQQGGPTNTNQPTKTTSPALPLTDQQVNQYFQDNLNLNDNTNYTQKYQQQYPAERRNAATLAEFTKSQPITTKLPTPNENQIHKLSADSPPALANYLNIANTISVLVDRVAVARAVADVVYKKDPSGANLQSLRARLLQEHLAAANVPPSALPLHRLLLGYTQLLSTTYSGMALVSQDPMKTIVAMRQLEEINKQYYPLIAVELDRLAALPAAPQ